MAPKASQKRAKESQEGAKVSQRAPKGNQKGAKGVQKGTEGSQKGAKREPKDDRNAFKHQPSEEGRKSDEKGSVARDEMDNFFVQNREKYHRKNQLKINRQKT